MSDVIVAVYENGVLRPDQPVTGLSPGQRVWVTVGEPLDLSQAEQKEAGLIRRLEAQGLVEKPAVAPAAADFRPLQMSGPGLETRVSRSNVILRGTQTSLAEKAFHAAKNEI